MIKRRPPKEQFTPAALVAFKRMRELENECTCALSADPFLNRCAACDEWWARHSLVVIPPRRSSPLALCYRFGRGQLVR